MLKPQKIEIYYWEGKYKLDALFALAIHLIPLLNPIERLHLAEKCVDFSTFQNIRGHDIFYIGVGIRQTQTRLRTLENFNGKEMLNQAETLLKKLYNRNIKTTNILESNYPPLLREIYSAPFLLFYMGNLPNPEQASLSIVGTRRPSLNAKQETTLFVREIAPHIGSVVSGLALGIDGTAHRAALAAKCHTSAVLGSGFDHLYPPANKKLAAEIVYNGGVLITEYSPEVAPTPYTFPARNRIVSGLSRSVIVIEAPHRSGALITANLALEQGRDIFVHKVGLKPGSGLENLYLQGALVLERGSDLLNSWGIHCQEFVKIEESKESLPAVGGKLKGKNEKSYDIAKILAENIAHDIGWSDDE